MYLSDIQTSVGSFLVEQVVADFYLVAEYS